VHEAFRHTPATKEAHCYSWMFAEVLGPYACAGSAAHVAAGGTPLRFMEIGFHRGDSAVRTPHKAGASLALFRVKAASICAMPAQKRR
jgi:hypothetical protein